MTPDQRGEVIALIIGGIALLAIGWNTLYFGYGFIVGGW